MDNEDKAKYRGTQTFFMSRDEFIEFCRSRYEYAQGAEQREREKRERGRENGRKSAEKFLFTK